jgi:hypothetical protein
MGLIVLYKMGLIKHLPEPNITGLGAEKVDASEEAYSYFETPDAAIGLGNYAVTLGLAAMGGKGSRLDDTLDSTRARGQNRGRFRADGETELRPGRQTKGRLHVVHDCGHRRLPQYGSRSAGGACRLAETSRLVTRPPVGWRAEIQKQGCVPRCDGEDGMMLSPVMADEQSAIAPARSATISIIVPVLNEAPLIRSFLTETRRCAPGVEIIVADGGSSDGTADLAAGFCDRVVRTAQSSAVQMNAGAHEA